MNPEEWYQAAIQPVLAPWLTEDVPELKQLVRY